MITNAIQITVFVEDRDDAKAFYTDSLGFVVRADEEFGDDWRYLTVSPAEAAETVLELIEVVTPEQRAMLGGQAADRPLVMFASDDIEADYQRLSRAGVTLHGEPTAVPGGRGVRFEDLDGNLFDLYQPDSSEGK